MKKRLQCYGVGCVLVVLLVLSGCASAGASFSVSVNSLSSTLASESRTYIILPGNENVNLNDLEFLEYMGYLKRALDIKGFALAENFEDADVAVLLSYGIGDPRDHHYSYAIPTWGQTGVSSSSTSGNVSVYGNTATYSSTTTYRPTWGVTGYNRVSGSYTTFFRYVVIQGYDLKKYLQSEELVQLWQTQITSRGSSSDLRYVFPVLIGAASAYLASDTKKIIELDLSENDPRVRRVKGLP